MCQQFLWVAFPRWGANHGGVDGIRVHRSRYGSTQRAQVFTVPIPTVVQSPRLQPSGQLTVSERIVPDVDATDDPLHEIRGRFFHGYG